MKTLKHVVEKNPGSYAAEAYRMLRNSLQRITNESGASCITVTSSKPVEGKSTVAGNLALALSQADKKTLLVDCDLRNPSLHKAFGLLNDIGLSDIMSEAAGFQECLTKYSRNLYVITSGSLPENPSDLFYSRNMTEFLKWAKSNFNYVILDTPPVTMFSDTQVLAAMTDGVLLVAARGIADYDSVAMAKELLAGVKANIIGAVINKADYGFKPGAGRFYRTNRKKERGAGKAKLVVKPT